MIHETMTFVVTRLNRALLERYPSDGDWVIASHVTTATGSAPVDAADKVLLTIVNLERDSTAMRTQPLTHVEHDSSARMNPTLQVSLDVLVSANFDRYEDGLNLLDGVIGYFQAKPLYTRQNAPDLPAGLERLTCDWVDLSLKDIHDLWAVLGGRYLPSVLYKIRMLSFQQGWIEDETPLISGLDVSS
ncbi:DUF4255 domain-containing protein [uncultured Ruegeria sp.]|uniref:DUF4255 domain-containing protein n=1 Tax=uncultured Ruegeria sp. TaxID=259304 RepID=UPI00261CE261|nr:DUF4255 domain-containing protein [uncultured Ruegeria sp.]